MGAGLAAFDMTAQRRRSAALDRRGGPRRCSRQAQTRTPAREPDTTADPAYFPLIISAKVWNNRPRFHPEQTPSSASPARARQKGR